jgi:cobalt-zinc-cadmium efflux system protein
MHGHHHHDHHDHGVGGHAAAGDVHDHHAHTDHATLGAFRLSVVLNTLLVGAQLAVGLVVGSMALVADAVHNAGDVIGLLLAWGAARLATQRPTPRHTYGLARSTILAALLNSGLLLVACGALAWESIGRFAEPYPVPGLPVLVTALFAVGVNGWSAALFFRQRHRDVNQRGAYLHLVADAGVSLGVVLAALLTMATGWTWVDPAVALLIVAVVFASAVGLMRESVELSLDAVPRGIDIAEVDAALRSLPQVRAVHDLHVWPLSTTVAALTAHVEYEADGPADALLAAAQAMLATRFGIHHVTLQFERLPCRQDCR